MSWPFGLDTSLLGGWLPLPRRSGAHARSEAPAPPRRSSGVQLRLSLTAEHPVGEER